MSLDTFMLEALHHATRMVREEGSVRPTFVIASAEGTYTLALASDGTLYDDVALQVVAAVMRWSMAHAFIVTCEHPSPPRIAVYVITADETRGVSFTLHKRPLRLGRPRLVKTPPPILQLRALIPPRVSALSEDDIMCLEEAFGMELEDNQPYYIS